MPQRTPKKLAAVINDDAIENEAADGLDDKEVGWDDGSDVEGDDLWGEFEDQREFINALYCGNGGTGKTTSALTMANTGQVLVISSESGLKKRALQRRGIDTSRIMVYPRAGDVITYRGIENAFWRIKADLMRDPESWAGTVWDSVTEIVKQLTKQVSNAAYDKGARMAERKGEEFERDPFFIARDDYGVMTQQVRDLVRMYRDLPCHFVVTSTLRREKDDDGEVVYVPDVTPALQSDLYAWMDVVCITQVTDVGGEDEYSGLFRPVGKYLGKDRFGALPRRMINPTFERLQAYVDEELDSENDPDRDEALERRNKVKAEREKALAESAQPGGGPTRARRPRKAAPAK